MSKKKLDTGITSTTTGGLITSPAVDYTSATYTIPNSGTYSINTGISSSTWVDLVQELRDLLEKNIECGNLIDWDIKVKDTELARKMYKEFSVKGGWLYAKKV